MAGKRSVFPCQFPRCNITCMSNSARIKHHSSHTNKLARAERIGDGGMEHRQGMEGKVIKKRCLVRVWKRKRRTMQANRVRWMKAGMTMQKEIILVTVQGDRLCSLQIGPRMRKTMKKRKKKGHRGKCYMWSLTMVDVQTNIFDYRGPDERLAELPQEIKDAGGVHC